jgi:gamma-glutamylcyclotransferase (GGCT)/AIG2-like uncharacterized protein YtfP
MLDRGINPISKEIGFLDNYKFIINKKSFKNPDIGFANIQKSDNNIVEGILYKILKEDIKKLDKYEGFPKHYNKKLLPIRNESGVNIISFVYISQPKWESKIILKTNKKYKKYILEGKQYLTKDYYNFLNENIKTD